MRWAAPQTEPPSRASSKLAPAVTHFPLLLFLEVLMSMRNSAERLSEKKEEGEEKREEERERARESKREQGVSGQDDGGKVPVTTLCASNWSHRTYPIWLGPSLGAVASG